MDPGRAHHPTALDPRRALGWLGQAMAKTVETDGFNIMPHPLRGLGKRLVSSSAAGVYVLDGVTPSGDRTVKEVLARYRVRVGPPTPLAPVPGLAHVGNTLRDEFPWFEPAIAWCLRHLAACGTGHGDFYLPPLALLGGPGIGKSAFINRPGELSGVPVHTVMLGGKADSRDLSGTARGWSSGGSSSPGSTASSRGSSRGWVA